MTIYVQLGVKLTPSQALLVNQLGEYADKDNEVYISLTQFATDHDLTRKQLTVALETMEKADYLSIKTLQGRNGGSLIHFYPDKIKFSTLKKTSPYQESLSPELKQEFDNQLETDGVSWSLFKTLPDSYHELRIYLLGILYDTMKHYFQYKDCQVKGLKVPKPLVSRYARGKYFSGPNYRMLKELDKFFFETKNYDPVYYISAVFNHARYQQKRKSIMVKLPYLQSLPEHEADYLFQYNYDQKYLPRLGERKTIPGIMTPLIQILRSLFDELRDLTTPFVSLSQEVKDSLANEVGITHVEGLRDPSIFVSPVIESITRNGEYWLQAVKFSLDEFSEEELPMADKLNYLGYCVYSLRSEIEGFYTYPLMYSTLPALVRTKEDQLIQLSPNTLKKVPDKQIHALYSAWVGEERFQKQVDRHSEYPLSTHDELRNQLLDKLAGIQQLSLLRYLSPLFAGLLHVQSLSQDRIQEITKLINNPDLFPLGPSGNLDTVQLVKRFNHLSKNLRKPADSLVERI